MTSAAVGDLILDEIRVTRVARRYRTPFGISSGTTGELVSLIVEVRAGDDTGIGEVSPMTAYTGETEDGVRSALEEHLLPALRGVPVAGIGAAHVAMDAAIRGQSLAKGALDIALHDLLARRHGLAVHHLLGGAVRDHVGVAWVIGLGDIDDVVDEARAAVARGFGHVKVKGGHDLHRDLTLVRRLVDELGVEAEIALDANEGYRGREAHRVLEQMDDAGLAMVEQPLPRWDLRGATRLTESLRMDVIADESVQSVHDAQRILDAGAADILNVKILKVGGLYRAAQIAALAAVAGVPIKVGSMPELGVATLAAAHFAVAAPTATVAGDFVGPLLVEGDPFATDLLRAADTGRLARPLGTGLGVDPTAWKDAA